MERRRLVGRRYEDYVRNNIIIELTPEEISWKMIIADPRYQPLLDRRRHIRRKSDLPLTRPVTLYTPGCSFFFMTDPFEE
ncbi:MAG: hypothetical protein D6681_20880 [Calditrichaeota bacterium]|nr:MAG: hypothetical protein D6681_20880 [Calditrichota bacterium]